MGGTNPYIPPSDVKLPEQRYRIRFRCAGQEQLVEVDPDKVKAGGYSRDGLQGSLLSIALAHDIEVDHACGGVCACSTCHVVVKQGLESCNEPHDLELDRVDEARGVTPQSRLACQCVPDGTQDVVVEIPVWNRNLAREAHH